MPQETTDFSRAESQFLPGKSICAADATCSGPKLKPHAAKADGIFRELKLEVRSKLSLHSAKAGGVLIQLRPTPMRRCTSFSTSIGTPSARACRMKALSI